MRMNQIINRYYSLTFFSVGGPFFIGAFIGAGVLRFPFLGCFILKEINYQIIYY
jgi:hypothetical protein